MLSGDAMLSRDAMHGVSTATGRPTLLALLALCAKNLFFPSFSLCSLSLL